MRRNENLTKMTTAGILLGFGLGGFIDKITFHQLLEWHIRGRAVIPTSTLAALKLSLFWDGLIHALIWIVAATGLAILWSAVRGPHPIPTRRYLSGTMILGWGLLNLTQGMINHYILGLQNVSEVPSSDPWNMGFLFIGGIAFTGFGWLMMRAGKRRFVPPRRKTLLG